MSDNYRSLKSESLVARLVNPFTLSPKPQRSRAAMVGKIGAAAYKAHSCTAPRKRGNHLVGSWGSYIGFM